MVTKVLDVVIVSGLCEREDLTLAAGPCILSLVEWISEGRQGGTTWWGTLLCTFLGQTPLWEVSSGV